MDRPHAGHRRPYGDAGHGVFRQRCTKDAFGAEVVDEAPRRALDRLVIVHVETEHEYARIACHFLRNGLAQRKKWHAIRAYSCSVSTWTITRRSRARRGASSTTSAPNASLVHRCRKTP